MPKLFVIMPFGSKEVKRSDATFKFDFDHIYRSIIRPAAESRGWQVLRIDEVSQTGDIADQYLRELAEADVVIADVSQENGNVFYELGVRHAISPSGTILIAVAGVQLPFDIKTHRVIFYSVTDDGRVVEEAIRATQESIATALAVFEEEGGSNPIREFLERILYTVNPSVDAEAFERELDGRIERCKSATQLIGVWQWAKHFERLPPFSLLRLARSMSEHGEWSISVDVLRKAVAARPGDFELQRTLGWHLRNAGEDRFDDAEMAFQAALALNSADPETLGMLGGLYKRKGNLKAALQNYRSGLQVAPDDTYMLVNLAFLETIVGNRDEGRNRYSELIERLAGKSSTDPWNCVLLGESHFVLEQDELANFHYVKAISLGADTTHLRSSADQLELFAREGYRPDVATRFCEQIRSSITNHPSRMSDVSGPTARRNESKLPVVIHLSDVHFGTKKSTDGKNVQMHRFFDGDYSVTLSKHIIAEFTDAQSMVSFHQSQLYLIVSGDLAYSATSDEFRLASEFLSSVTSALEIPKERVFLVPGNHDVDWSVASENRFDNYIGCLVDFYGEQLFRQRHSHVSWDLKFNSKRPLPEQLFGFYCDNSICIACLNSCVYETNQNHYGFVGGKQLNYLEQAIQNANLPLGVPRIAVIHHHLHPYPEQLNERHNGNVWMDPSTIRDAGIVERQLERLGFDIVLHGHKHKPQLRETLLRRAEDGDERDKHLIVCGAGSASVNSSELEHNVPNHYAILEFLSVPRRRQTDFVRVSWRELALSADAQWVTPRSWVLKG